MRGHHAGLQRRAALPRSINLADQRGQRIGVEHERNPGASGRLDSRQRCFADAGGRANDHGVETPLRQQIDERFRGCGFPQHDGGDMRRMDAEGIPVARNRHGACAVVQRGRRGKP